MLFARDLPQTLHSVFAIEMRKDRRSNSRREVLVDIPDLVTKTDLKIRFGERTVRALLHAPQRPTHIAKNRWRTSKR